MISRHFKRRSNVSVKNTFFSSIKKILSALGRLGNLNLTYTILRKIKPRILHEFFGVYFRFVVKGGREVLVSVREVILSVFKGPEFVLNEFGGKLRSVILNEMLGSLIEFNDEYLKRTEIKFRKFRFLKERVFRREIKEEFEGKEFLGVKEEGLSGWRREFALALPLVKEQFVKLYFNNKQWINKSQNDKLKIFLCFSDLTDSVVNKLKSDSDNVLFIDKVADFFKELNEIIFCNKFQNFSTKKEEEHLLENMLKASDKINLEFFFNSNDCGLQKKGNRLYTSISSIEKTEENNFKDFDLSCSYEKIRNDFLLNGSSLDVMSLLSCEQINKEYGNNYSRKKFNNTSIEFDE